jgi:hypothetical protein
MIEDLELPTINIKESCKNRAHTNLGLSDFISSRFHRGSPVRLGIMPFSVPANLSSYNTEHPGVGNRLAWSVRSHLLGKEEIPIVEVFNRPSLPGHKDEFFTGNFGAISLAREAGYDLVMVGYLEPTRSINTAILHTKIIEVEGGITVWFGESELLSREKTIQSYEDSWFGRGEVPSKVFTNELFDSLAKCAVEGMLAEAQ